MEPEEVPSDPWGVAVAELAAPNGRNLNGRNLNGRNLNGKDLGSTLVSVNYAGARRASRPGAALDTVWLEGTVFHGIMARRELSGVDFRDMYFTGNTGDGRSVLLRVDSVIPGRGPDRDIWTYRVSYRDWEDGQWYPLCQASDGTALNAIPVKGHWDYRAGVPGQGGAKIRDPKAFTFACEGAAIAKCVRFGYKPWATVKGVSLEDHHQACTRLVRADFCGDGTSYTVDGNWVNLYDALGVQEDTEAWKVEAEWDTRGARCVTHKTRASKPIVCAGSRQLPACGDKGRFSTGTLLISETPPVN